MSIGLGTCWENRSLPTIRCKNIRRKSNPAILPMTGFSPDAIINGYTTSWRQTAHAAVRKGDSSNASQRNWIPVYCRSRLSASLFALTRMTMLTTMNAAKASTKTSAKIRSAFMPSLERSLAQVTICNYKLSAGRGYPGGLKLSEGAGHPRLACVPRVET